jgi:hypothetical protein
MDNKPHNFDGKIPSNRSSDTSYLIRNFTIVIIAVLIIVIFMQEIVGMLESVK